MSKKDFSVQISEILDKYEEEVKRTANEVFNEVSKETAQRLKATSPRQSGRYARGWKVTVKPFHEVNEYVVHNTRYQLTHLLENGHVIRNQYGTYGRTRPQKHIEPAEQWAQQEATRRIEGRLS